MAAADGISRRLVLTAIVLTGMVVHGVFWATTQLPPEIATFDPGYARAMTGDWWTYVAHSAIKPPLLYVFHAIAAHFGAAAPTALLAMSVLFALAGSVFLYLGARLSGAGQIVAAAVSLIFSVASLHWDAMPANYDAPVWMLTTAFLWACARWIRHCAEKGAIAVAITGSLLIMQSSVGLTVVPAVVAAVLALLGPGQGWRKRMARGLGALLFPLLVAAVLVAKNGVLLGMPAPSNLGGHTLLLEVMTMHGWDMPRIRERMAEAGAPEWYLWCWDHPIPPAAEAAKPVSWLWARTYGGCHREEDFAELATAMRGLGADKAAAAAEETARLQREQPDLLTWISGRTHMFNTPWFNLYSAESGRLAGRVLTHPWADWLRTARNIHGNMFSRLGPWSLAEKTALNSGHARLLGMAPVQAGFSALGGVLAATYLAIPVIVLVMAAGLAAAALSAIRADRIRLILGLAVLAASIPLADLAIEWFYYGWPRSIYRLAPLTVAVAMAAALAEDAWRRRAAQRPGALLARFAADRKRLAAWIPAVLPLCTLPLVFTMMVGTENERYFQQIVPYLLLVLALTPGAMLHSWRR